MAQVRGRRAGESSVGETSTGVGWVVARGPAEAAEKFRNLSAGKAKKLLELLDRWLAKHDRDVNPEVRGTGRMKAGLGIYYFEEVLDSGNPDIKGHGGKS